MRILSLSTITIALLFACGIKEEAKKESTSDSLAYRYDINGCDTGSHSFGSKEELCKGLENQKLNNSCATDMRAQTFKRLGCPGEFTLK